MRWTAVLSWHSTDSRLDATADMGRHGLPAGSAAILALGACLGACLAVAMVSAAPGRVAIESSQQGKVTGNTPASRDPTIYLMLFSWIYAVNEARSKPACLSRSGNQTAWQNVLGRGRLQLEPVHSAA